MQHNERNKKIEDLKNYLIDAETRIKNILEKLNWNKEDTLKEFNSNSGIKTENNKEDSEDLLYPETYKQLHTITLDQKDLSKIFQDDNTNSEIPKELPNKFSDMQTKFDRKQKLKIYDYVIEKTGKYSEPEIFSLPTKEENSKEERRSFANIVALRRDIKRRRLKYRIGKDPPLSTTEEFRNLIEIQMGALEEYNNKKNLKKYKTKCSSSVDQTNNNNVYTKERKHSIYQKDKTSREEDVYHKSHKNSQKVNEDRVLTLDSKNSKHKLLPSHEEDLRKNYIAKYKKRFREKSKSKERKESKSSKNSKKSKKKSKTKDRVRDKSPNVNHKHKKRKKDK
ncbi:uncharacterized protein MAL13P1.304-like, partial [Condylostylus longicornis]|uniref:uncharacterized protein MAL13P1.304-like n=1 Tax=Condylostylus longicornis TaxID=2530218 RepID=UPI00244DC25D